MDINSLVAGLVKAESTGLANINSRTSLLKSANTTLSDISVSLSALGSAADALSSAGDANSLKATSTDAAIVATANGAAEVGSYQISVQSLAKEHKSFSARQSTSGDLGQAGTIRIGVGSGASEKSGTLTVDTTDSLDEIAAKINGLGLRAKASVVYDGTGYRLQVRGLDTGSANAVTFEETGTTLDLNGDGSDPAGGGTFQSASDAVLSVDGVTVRRSSNQVVGVVPGVTLALTAETTKPTTVQVASDITTIQSKISTFVTAYNKVISSIHSAAGYGTTKAANSALAGDSALRTVGNRLLSLAGGRGSSGTFSTLADIGVALNRDGVLALDTTKLSAALSKDAASVTSLLARPQGATSGGVMADIQDAIASMTDAKSGVLANRITSFTTQVKALGERATKEQARLDSYEERLRKQFSAMDAAVAHNQSLLSTVTNMFSNSSG